jgi:hypothetical protein
MLVALLGGAVALGPLACVTPRDAPALVYYTLSVPGEPSVELPGAVRIGSFSADEPYRSSRLAYRRSSVRIEYYGFHRWAGSPRSVVATAVRDYLGAPAGTGAPFSVDGHVRRIEEVDAPDGWRGVIALDLAVQRQGGPRAAWTYEESELAEAQTPEAVIAALSRALGRILDRFVADWAASVQQLE